MIFFPNCKINIGLNITEKRPDGFHNIETVFVPISISDVIEITENKSDKKINFKNTGLEINCKPGNNLIIKAYELIKSDFDIPPINIHIHKKIPFGAGLGGGSSDASFTLKALNSLFKLNLTNKKLSNYAGKLGSDCAFFIENKAVFAEKKGDVFSDISINLKDYHIYVIKPDITVGTQEAYQNIIPKNTEIKLPDLIKKDISTWKENIINDFEHNIFKKYPEIEKIKNNLYKQGAIYASMSGSGSSVYGIFKNRCEIKKYNYFLCRQIIE